MTRSPVPMGVIGPAARSSRWTVRWPVTRPLRWARPFWSMNRKPSPSWPFMSVAASASTREMVVTPEPPTPVTTTRQSLPAMTSSKVLRTAGSGRALSVSTSGRAEYFVGW